MPYETKEDFDDAYRIQVERRMPGGGPPPAEDRPAVFLHYHRFGQRPIMASRWATLQPILNIQSTDFVCVVGAGFGWGVDAIVAETGATVVGIDISQYIADEQANTEEAEIRAEIDLVGLDPDTGRGAEILAFVFEDVPRSNVVVLQNDASTQNQRQEIRTALGGNWPTVVVYEDIIDDTWTDQDIINARNAGNGFGGQQRLIFVYRGTSHLSPPRTHQALFDLLPGQPNPSEVISVDGEIYLGS